MWWSVDGDGAGAQCWAAAHAPDRLHVCMLCHTADTHVHVQSRLDRLCCLSKRSAVVTTDGHASWLELRHNKLLSCTSFGQGGLVAKRGGAWHAAAVLQHKTTFRRHAAAGHTPTAAAHTTDTGPQRHRLAHKRSQSATKQTRPRYSFIVTPQEGKQPALSTSVARRRWTRHRHCMMHVDTQPQPAGSSRQRDSCLAGRAR